jgi:hypothetical protein
MFDFNAITKDKEKEVAIKFKEHGRGIVMSKFNANFSDGDAALWNDLIDPRKYSERVLITRMLDFARVINTNCNDEFVGRTDIAFVHETELEEKVEFTFLDMYTFLRAILRHRRASAEYKEKKTEITQLEKFIEDNKTLNEKRADAKKRLAELQQDL